MTRAAGTVGSLELLAARARKGDRRAAAQLRRRMAPQVRELTRALSADPRLVPAIVRQALNDALADDKRPYTWALVAAVQRRCAAGRTTPGRKHERTPESRLLTAVGVLCDMQGHTHDTAAALLGEPVDRVAALHAQGRSELGVDRARTHCRGWHLVSRMADLTPPEQEAGRRHLASCRPCEDALAARAAARLRLKAALPVGGTVVGGGVVALFAAVGGGSAGVGAAAVGAAAVLGTAGTVAVAVPPAPPPPAAPAPAAPTEIAPSEGVDDSAGDDAVELPAGEVAPQATGAPAVPAPGGTTPTPAPTPAPTAAPTPSATPPAGPLPTAPPSLPGLPDVPPTDVPVLPSPSSLPALEVVTDPLRLEVDASGGCRVVGIEAGGGLLPDVALEISLPSEEVPPTCAEQVDVTESGEDPAAPDSTQTARREQHAASDRETRPQDERLRDLREPRLPGSDVSGLLGSTLGLLDR